MKYNVVSRIRLLSVLILCATVLFIGRLFMLQVLQGERFSKTAEKQYATTAPHLLERGSIFFTQKNGQLISAGTMKASYFVAINPKEISSPEEVYIELSSVMELNRDEFMARATKNNDPYEVIARGLDQETSQLIRALKIPYVWVYQENTRFYPGNNLAAHALGLVARSKDDGDSYSGRYGLERYYNDTLSRNENDLYVNFFAEIFSDLGKSLSTPDTEQEGDIITSIEPVVQETLEKELAGIAEHWKPEALGGIVIEPKTGRVIALASLPTFDPNEPGKESSSKVFSNPLVENVYEMGSIIKPLTMAAALDEGVVTTNTTYDDKGFRILNGKRIENFDGKGRGVVPMQEILSQSLNTGSVFVMEKLGIDLFRAKMLAYGLGTKTGVDLPNETSGLVRNLDSKREIEHATAAYGQGIAVTPFEMVRALSALGNGGLLVEPHLLDRIDYGLGSSKPYEPKNPPTQILKPGTSKEISRMLTEVVDTALAKGKAKIPTHSIAAKTGTAQISQEGGKGYYSDRYLHSFFGYFPSQNPRFLVFFYSKHPQGAKYASETLTEPFMNMSKFLINYYEIPPDREPGPESAEPTQKKI